MSDQVRFDLGGEFEDRNYKSCFARSVAVNSQLKQTKSLDFKQLQQNGDHYGEVLRKPCVANRPFTLESQEAVRLRKHARNNMEDSRRFSCSNINSNRRASICYSSRKSDIPVEAIVNQSKIETLQWQLKESQKSREMYRAVMKQVVTFLEKAHHSLELLGNRLNRKHSVPRSKSEHQIGMEKSRSHDSSTLTPGLSCIDDYLAFKDSSWKQNKEEDPSPEEIPPDRLSKEAFRLLRTTQSLLNIREPDLAQINNQPENDIEFLAQLAEEFPTPESKPQRATSFSLSPKLILPETEVKISTAFNRKLSLQLSEVRRSSVSQQTTKNMDSARGSVAESDTELLNENVFINQKSKSEKSNSPATGSISSVEDESGFSSMNSFQDVGLPLVNSTMTEAVSTKNALLRSMLHNNSDYSSLNFSLEHSSLSDTNIQSNGISDRRETALKSTVDDYKLWQKPQSTLVTPQHKRWNSSPSEDIRNQSLKVLWV